MTPLIFFAFALLLVQSFCGTAQEWKKRTIYQLMTDRFARTDGSTSSCQKLNKYCGGTFVGMKQKLSYIKNMGFDAIWISPIPENKGDDYHGYGFSDLYKVNHHFGTAKELKELVDECHRMGIWVMLDLVANHVACLNKEGDFSEILPFNRAEYYHKYCATDFNRIWQDQWMRENCRFFCMPDLDQSHPFVRNGLKLWVSQVVKQYGFDGLRIDTVAHVPVGFWKEFADSSGVFQLGEVMNSDSRVTAAFQGPLASVLSYPMYDVIRKVFNQRESMYGIRTRIDEMRAHFKDTTVLGNFIDNHDKPRFLYITKDAALLKSALAFLLFAEGIPIVYYGTEQSFNGGDDPWNRESLWQSMDQNSDMYLFIKKTIAARKQYKVWSTTHVERYVDNNIYVFSRGKALVCVTNQGNEVSVTVQYHEFKVGAKLCNFYSESDCVTVEKEGIKVTLQGGLPKIYVPAQ